MPNDPKNQNDNSVNGLKPVPETEVPNELDRAERDKQRQRINDLARDNQHGRGQDEDERSGQGNQGGHGDRGGR